MNAPHPLPPDEFLRSFEIVPRAAVCLLVRDAEGGVLLTQRATTMATLPGAWHLPGAFLWRGETLAACVDRVARKELGAGVVGELRPRGFFEDLDGDPRGHVVDLVIEVGLDGEPRATEESGAVRFFASVPPDVAFHHDRVLRAAGLDDERA